MKLLDSWDQSFLVDLCVPLLSFCECPKRKSNRWSFLFHCGKPFHLLLFISMDGLFPYNWFKECTSGWARICCTTELTSRPRTRTDLTPDTLRGWGAFKTSSTFSSGDFVETLAVNFVTTENVLLLEELCFVCSWTMTLRSTQKPADQRPHINEIYSTFFARY